MTIDDQSGFVRRLPQVSVVIPHYRDLAGLDRCLRALSKQDFPAAEFEIVVADNNSPEGRDEIAKVISGRARLVVVHEPGAGPARNGAVEIARGEILAFTDSDCVPEPSWLREGIAALEHHDFIGGKVVVLVDDLYRMTSVEAFERVFAFDFKSYNEKKGFTGAGNLFCKRNVFDRVGGFRAQVSEDVEWSHRATSLGLKLGYAPKAVVGHPARRSWDQLKSKWKRVNAETYKLYCERPAGRAIWIFRTALLPLSALVHTPKIFFSDDLKTLSQRLAAMKVLWTIRCWRFADALSLTRGARV